MESVIASKRVSVTKVKADFTLRCNITRHVGRMTLLIASVGIAGYLALPRIAHLPSHKATASTQSDFVRLQVRDDLQQVIEENAKASDYANWKQSGFTPSEVFQNLEALNSPIAWKSLCEELQALPIEKL